MRRISEAIFVLSGEELMKNYLKIGKKIKVAKRLSLKGIDGSEFV